MNRNVLASALFFLLTLWVSAALASDPTSGESGGGSTEQGVPAAPALDPTKIVGPAACAECHEKSEESWLKTRHNAIFKETHLSDEGKAIARRMGIESMKAPDSNCAGCHYTVAESEGTLKVISGVSCESCHGAAADWLVRHSGFSGKEEADETAAEKEARWADSEAAGMIRPSDIYALALNCYGCHVMPKEKLVNVGEHSSGSEFELVAWSQGEVRHNVWYTEANEEASTERRRQLYLAGQLAEMDTALRALGFASIAIKPGSAYAPAMAQRVTDAMQSLEQIDAATDIADLGALTDEVAKVAVVGAAFTSAADKAGNPLSWFMLKMIGAVGFVGAADQVAAAAPGLLADPGALSGLDSLLPSVSEYVGDPIP